MILNSGSDAKNVATLFRVIGAHRLNHFTLAVLHGACASPYDPTCQLLSLYPVKSAMKFEVKHGKLQKCKVGDGNEEQFLVGEFCDFEFPETFKLWKQAVQSDNDVKDIVSNSDNKLKYPTFQRENALVVAYTKASQSSKLRKKPLGAACAVSSRNQSREKRIKKLKKYKVRSASLEGCLLHFIQRSGCKGNVGVVLAINDTLEPFGNLLQQLPKAMKRTIIHFVMAVVVAGLPSGEAIFISSILETTPKLLCVRGWII